MMIQTTIASIRAMSTVPSDTLFFTLDLLQQGIWQYDPNDSTSVDNLGTVLVTASGKRIKRLYENMVDVRWFGAKGDGLADDTTAINAAFNFMGTTGGNKTSYVAVSNSGTVNTIVPTYTGQSITLCFDSAGTTLIHSSSIFLKGGINFSPTPGQVITLYREYANAWREISRQ